MATIVATAVLVSMGIVPIILWLFQCRVYDLFKVSGRRFESAMWIGVIAVHMVAAILWLTIRFKILGESVMSWALLTWLVYLWYRVIIVVVGHRVPSDCWQHNNRTVLGSAT